jgi:cytohesin
MDKGWINREDAFGETPLVRALRCGNQTLINFMLGQDRDDEPAAPVDTPEDSLQSAAYWGAAQAVHALLENGADATGRDNSGETPLHKAARNGRCEAVEALLEHGALVNVPDDQGLTPLHWATLAGDPEVAELLLEQGADPRASAGLLGDLSPRAIASLMGYDELVDVFNAHGAAVV